MAKEGMMDVSKWEKWWANTGEDWFKEMGLVTTRDIAGAAFGAGFAAGESFAKDTALLKKHVKAVYLTGTMRGQ